MNKQSFPRIPDSKWVYFVYNWGSPIGVFTNVILAAALFKKLREKWGNPPEGALSVVRYRPAVDFYKFKQEDITESILKYVCND